MNRPLRGRGILMALTHNQYAVAAITATLCLAGLYTVVGAGLSSTDRGGFESAVEDLELKEGKCLNKMKDKINSLSKATGNSEL